MAGPLLATKLHAPRLRRGTVTRPRLLERLDRGREARLTLVSAPAGFGKTTLLAGWLGTAGQPTAWLSLDQRDNDPVVFWSYVLTALHTATDERVSSSLTLLQSAQASLDEVLATLLNELDAVPGELVLVLDDYHLIETREVHDGIAFLLEHLPSQVHLLIATRADPPLPLARMRARGELIEVRADDLRFTAEEAAAYLNEATGLALAAQDVAALEDRTEGWIAALQLAALSMRGREDVASFIAGFAGDDRHVVDYLIEEVLQRQPPDVRDFLVQTSILSRLTAALCDAVTGGEGGKAMLDLLDRENLFLVPLDERRRWYRYHHLFAEMLRARLLDERPEQVAQLHRRAGDWYARSGEPGEAIRHALAGGDFEGTADQIERAMPALRQNRQEATLRSWLEALPDEVLRTRPVLSTTYAGVLLMHGELAGVEERLRDAERWLDAVTGAGGKSDAGTHGLDEAAVRGLRSEISLYRAGQSRVSGDVVGTMTHAHRVLELTGEGEHLLRGAAAGLLGLAHWSTGDLETAHRWWSDSYAELGRAGHHADTLGVAIALADIRRAQGRLQDAMSTYEQGLADATAHGLPVLRGAADMHVGMSEVLRERNDLAAARRHLEASAQLGEHAGLPQNRHRWRIAMARLREAEGDLADAVALLNEAERLYVGDMFPDVRPIPALRARVWVVQGKAEEALSWARERGLSSDDEVPYLREFEYITLARALLARCTAAGDESACTGATVLLQRLLQKAEEGERAGSVIELLVLQSVALQARGDVPGALAALARALALAEPHGYVRVFLDEGAAIATLLKALPESVAPAYVRLLLTAFAPATPTDPAVPAQHGLIAPLSSRELDVLRLLGSDLDGPSVARELVVSLNTVRTHTKNIYAKLGVNNRRAAVRRAAELGLFGRGHGR